MCDAAAMNAEHDLVTAFESAKERIRAYARANGIKRATLARRAGLHPNALRGMYEDDWTPRPDTVLKLYRVIHQDRPQDTIQCDSAKGEVA